MNKQDLKAALNKIKPSESLVESTLKKANELRYNNERKRSAFTFEGFNFKLASAVCAFAIVLSLGIFAGSNGFFTVEKNPPIEEVNFRHAEEMNDTQQKNDSSSDAALIMIEDAKKENSSWAVIEGVVSGAYPASSNEGKIHYLVQIDEIKLCDIADKSLESVFENGLVAAFDTEVGDEKFGELLNFMSSPMYIRVERDSMSEETDWKIVDFASLN